MMNSFNFRHPFMITFSNLEPLIYIVQLIESEDMFIMIIYRNFEFRKGPYNLTPDSLELGYVAEVYLTYEVWLFPLRHNYAIYILLCRLSIIPK